MLKFLRKEITALAGEFAAVLTVLSQIASETPLPAWSINALVQWRQLLTGTWQTIFPWLQNGVHPDYAAALSLAVFLVWIGFGARISRSQSRAPLAPIEFRFLNDMSLVSLLIYAGLIYAFLIGTGPLNDASTQPKLFSNEFANRYTYALVLTVGYALGDFIGHKAFHRRFFRMAVMLGLTLTGLVLATV